MATLPTEAVKQAALFLRPGKALDIACGAGRHTVWLHENGWQVTAVDRNAEAISQIRSDYPLIDARVIDLEKEALPEAVSDLVICWLYFQRELYPAIRRIVRPGGIAVLSALKNGRFAANPGELVTYFPGWSVLREAESTHAYELTVQSP